MYTEMMNQLKKLGLDSFRDLLDKGDVGSFATLSCSCFRAALRSRSRWRTLESGKPRSGVDAFGVFLFSDFEVSFTLVFNVAIRSILQPGPTEDIYPRRSSAVIR